MYYNDMNTNNTFYDPELYESHTVICPVCKQPAGLYDGWSYGVTGLAWYDPKLQCYTHKQCNSQFVNNKKTS